jgi:hypothetical protein
VLLFTGGLLHLLAHARHTTRIARRRALSLAALCIAAVVMFGFGSALSIYHQAALAASLMWCATVALVASTGDSATMRSTSTLLLVAACAAMLVSNVVDSRHHPFDVGDTAEQRTPVRLGVHGDRLLVDVHTAGLLDHLQQTATAAGFCAGTPVIGMAWGWASTTAFAVGARVPEHLIVTIFGYPGAARVLDVTMHDLTGPAWHDAWVTTENPAALQPRQANEVRAGLDRLPGAIGRTFPRDYTMVSETDGIQLWRPSDLTRSAACR